MSCETGELSSKRGDQMTTAMIVVVTALLTVCAVCSAAVYAIGKLMDAINE